MNLTSPAFLQGATIPRRYTQFDENVNPPLLIEDVPEAAVSLVLLMDDPDVPAAAGVAVWDHWVVFNLSTALKEIPEAWDVEGVRGVGTRGLLTYSGPRPPDREHRYFFRLYALDKMLELQEGATKAEVEEGMRSHVVDQAELMGVCAPQV